MDTPNNISPTQGEIYTDNSGSTINSGMIKYFFVGRKFKLAIILFIIIIVIAVTSFFLLKNVFNNDLGYTYLGKKLSLGDYTFTDTKDELIFIGKFENMYPASNGSVYATVTYTKSGKKRIFFIPLSMLALYEPKTFTLGNIDQQTLISTVSAIAKLKGRTMAFYVATTQDPKSIPPDQRNNYGSYFDLLGKHFSCNQQFIQELTSTSQATECAPFVQTIVASM